MFEFFIIWVGKLAEMIVTMSVVLAYDHDRIFGRSALYDHIQKEKK